MHFSTKPSHHTQHRLFLEQGSSLELSGYLCKLCLLHCCRRAASLISATGSGVTMAPASGGPSPREMAKETGKCQPPPPAQD